MMAENCSNETQGEDFIAIEGDVLFQYVGGDLVLTNISTPSKPNQISSNEMTFSRGTTNMFVLNSYVYFVSYDNELTVFDCTNPLDVKIKYSSFFTGCIHDIVVDNGRIYVTEDKNVTIYDDLALGINKVGEVTLLSTYYLMYLAVHDNFAYAYDFQEDLRIVNVTNPAKPEYNSSWAEDGVRQITHNGDVILEFRFGSPDIRILDVSIPGKPEIASYIDISAPFTSLRDAYYYKQHIYALFVDGGLVVYNASDLTNITEITEYQLPSIEENQGFFNMEINNDHIFIGNFYENHLFVVNISDPANPEHVYPLIKTNVDPIKIIAMIIAGTLFTSLLVVRVISFIRYRKDYS